MIVSGRVEYDALGRAVAQYYPTAHAKGGDDTVFQATTSTQKPTVTDYDVLDRVTQTTLPGESYTTLELNQELIFKPAQTTLG